MQDLLCSVEQAPRCWEMILELANIPWVGRAQGEHSGGWRQVTVLSPFCEGGLHSREGPAFCPHCFKRTQCSAAKATG